jgi:hypothetical protein
MTKIKLEYVHFMPSAFKLGVLYVSKEFEIAVHLCACGCGSKVRTPLGPTEWTFQKTEEGPSLEPSIGNWQLPCRSHYVIKRGEILWARPWSHMEIERGSKIEQIRREVYYRKMYSKQSNIFKHILEWFRKLFQ